MEKQPTLKTGNIGKIKYHFPGSRVDSSQNNKPSKPVVSNCVSHLDKNYYRKLDAAQNKKFSLPQPTKDASVAATNHR